MTYHELVEKVRTALVVKADASKIEEHIAVQVNVTGEAEGAFYIEIKEGVLCVEPYTYDDRDFLLTGDGTEILAVAQGKKNLETAIAERLLSHEGNWNKALTLGSIIPEAKKPGRKPKTEAPAEVQLSLTEEVPAEEKPAEKKTAPKKSAGRKPKTETAAKTRTANKTTRTAKKDTLTKKTTKKTKTAE